MICLCEATLTATPSLHTPPVPCTTQNSTTTTTTNFTAARSYTATTSKTSVWARRSAPVVLVYLIPQPFGEIPVLEDGDPTLYQSRAIARHVLRKYKPELLRGGDLAGSATVDVWVDVEAHQLEPVLLPIVVNCIINQYVGRDCDQGVVDENLPKLRKVLDVYEARLSVSRCLAGADITAADLCHFGFMRYFMATEYAGVVDAYPHVKAWWNALLARPSVQKVMAGMPPDFGFGSGNIP